MSDKKTVLPKLHLDQISAKYSVKDVSNIKKGSQSARIAEPPRMTSVSSSYMNTAREVVFSYKERNGPGNGGLGEMRQRHRLRGFKTEGPVLKRIDFASDKAMVQLPEYLRVKQEGINAVTAPKSPRSKDKNRIKGSPGSPNNRVATEASPTSQSSGGTLDLSCRKLGDDYSYAAIKALGTTLHRTDVDYLVKKELSEKAFHTMSEGEESPEEDSNVDERNRDIDIYGQQKAERNVRRKKKKDSYGYVHEQKHYTITSINLRDNRISDPGMVRISTYLRKDLSLSQFLRSLDLSGNVMRKKGAEALGNLVRSAPDLCHLSLEKLRLDDTVVRVLCRSIRHKWVVH